MEYRKCFVPTCSNNSNNSPNKIFRDVGVEYYKVYKMYCCEDHFDPKNDLINYHRHKLLNQEPRLKPTASVCYIAPSKSEDSTELAKLLLHPATTYKPVKWKYEDAVTPSTSSYSIIPMKFCRVCLAVDVKMYDMKEFQLRKMYQNITGIPACDETERVLHHVCWECAARLTAASAFRDKALFTDTLLKDVVHRNKRGIEQLRQHHSHLKSPLTIQTVFTSADIGCGDTPLELQRDETGKRKVYKRRTKRKSNEEEGGTAFDKEEPLVEFPVKTEIESDPFAENDINNQIEDGNSETLSQVTHFDDSFTPSKDDNYDEIRNTEEHINEKSEDIEMMATPITYGINLVEDNAEKQPTNDSVDKVLDEPSSKDTEVTIGPNDGSDIVLEEDNENPMFYGFSIHSDTSSSEEDGQSLAELVSARKAKKQTSRKVRAKR